MPNTYIKAEKYVALGLASLYEDAFLPNVVTRFDGGNFKNAKEDTVVVAKSKRVTTARDYEWRTRTAPIVLDKIGQTSTSITLGTHTYSAVPITDEELTYDVTNFQTDIVDPQLDAVRDRLEIKVYNALKAANYKVTNGADAAEADDPWAWALDLRELLNNQGTPIQGRVLLVGTAVARWIMESEKLFNYDKEQAKTAFREATFGRIAGFDVTESSLIGPNEIFAHHPSAVILANVAPDVPEGVTYGAKRNFKGYGLRVIRDYDPNYLRDRSIVSTFTGTASVNDELQTTGTGINKALVLDVDGNPTYTGKNVRGTRGTFTPAA